MAAPLERLRRALTLIPLLQRRQGMRITAIARYLGVTPREVSEEIRDLVMMCGVPPYFPHNYIGFFIEGDRVFVRFAEHFRRPVRLTLPEALSLNLALRTLEGSSGRAFGPALLGLRRKIREVLAPEEARSLQDAERRIVAPTGPGAEAARRLQVLRDAMARTRRCRIVYFASHRGALTERVVEPLGVVENGGDWYCVAQDSVRRTPVPFRVDRIRTVTVLEDEEFEPPPHFDASKWRGPEMFRPRGDESAVRIRFGPEVARFIREQSDPREITETPDGGVVRRLRSSSIQWVVAQVLRHAPHAEVLDPPEVRAAVAETCAAVLAATAPGRAPRAAGTGRRAGREPAAARSRAPARRRAGR
ncbi:MAG: WYL domain-containing protein [Planctomycetes bacterium]|nr:WYL domain-containing protein [Planctomycetota bacterium]